MTRIGRRNSGGSESQWLANCGSLPNKKKNESISHPKKDVMRGFEPEKNGLSYPIIFPYPPFPCREHSPTWPVDVIFHARGWFAAQTLSRLLKLLGIVVLYLAFWLLLVVVWINWWGKKKRPSGIWKMASFVWSVNSIGRIVFWSWFEGLVGFAHSKRKLSLKSCFFFFYYQAKRKKTKRLKCIFLGNVIEVSFGLAVEGFFSMVMSACARARTHVFSLL